MMIKKLFAIICCCSFLNVFAQNKDNDRKTWLDYLDKIARPVLSNLAKGQLKEKMPVELSKTVDNKDNRKHLGSCTRSQGFRASSLRTKE